MSITLEYFHGDELASSTYLNKYALKDKEGKVLEESPDDMHKRLAKEFARIEEHYRYNKRDGDSLKLSHYGYVRPQLDEEAIYKLFKDFGKVIVGGSVMQGLGSGKPVSLSNCFVCKSPEDSYESIMLIRNYQAQLMKRRGGVGYDLSLLRPNGAKVDNSANTSTGPVSFMDVNSAITNEVAQGGRRGALMLSIDIRHPDSLDFITKKQDLTKVTGANISVQVPDDFMEAVINDNDYILKFPINLNIPYNYYEVNNPGFLSEYNKLYELKNLEGGGFVKKIKAKELWDTLMKCAWNTAEPGILFKDKIINFSPDGVYDKHRAISTNPCGEIPMGEFDSCRLIHINYSSFIDDPYTDEACINEEELFTVCYETMRLADDLVDLELEAVDKILKKINPKYNNLASVEDFNLEEQSEEFKLWWKIKETGAAGRRAGIGFTGLGDALAKLGLKFGSEEGKEAFKNLQEIKFYAELMCTIDMAIERGTFPSYDSEKEITVTTRVVNNIPVLSYEGKNDWYKFLVDEYVGFVPRLLKYGRRNISWSTVAPTGTVSIMAGCSSGIEPLFMPFYMRKRKCMSESDRVDFVDKVGEKFTIFPVVHPEFKRWWMIKNYPTIVDFDSVNWTEEALQKEFEESPWFGSTAPEIDWHDRIDMQAIAQQYTTHSISSTINLPKETTIEDIADIYIQSWLKGNKGQTIYRDGCRDGILSAKAPESVINSVPTITKKRPLVLEADYYQIKVKGEQFIVLVGLLDNKPYEIFTFRPKNPVSIDNHKGTITKVGKKHYKFTSDYIVITDIQLANTDIEENAATLYSSMLLRHNVDIRYIVKIAKKVNENITSFSSAMCRILNKYVPKEEIKGEVCPNCSGTRLVRESGCVKCLDCTYSKCD